MKYLIVTADTNDADYITEKNKISDKDLAKLKPLFKAIKEFKSYTVKKADSLGKFSWQHDHNFPYGGEDNPRTDLGEKTVYEIYPDHKEALDLFVDNYIPMGEYGIHTIESIEILDVKEATKII